MAFLCVSRGFRIFQHTDISDSPTVMFWLLFQLFTLSQGIRYFLLHPCGVKLSVSKSYRRHVLLKVAAVCIKRQSLFSASSATTTTFNLLIDKKASSKGDIPPLTPNIVLIRNVWSKQKKSQLSLLCPSQCPVLKPLVPLKYTRKNNEKEVLHRTSEIFRLLKVSHLSSGQLQRGASDPILAVKHWSVSGPCFRASEASTSFLLSTSARVHIHKHINQHIWVQSKQGLFTKSDRFTNTVWTGLTSLATGDSLDHSGFHKFEQKSPPFRQRWTNYRITCVIQTFLALWNLTCPERQCWKRSDPYLDIIRKTKRAVDPAEEGFVQTFMAPLTRLRSKDNPFLPQYNEAKKPTAPSHTVPPRQHLG